MKYDLVVIGSGPGGYVAAIRAAQLGFKTAIVEKYETLGGTCLNVGCIPSKALLDSTEHYHAASEKFTEHGIQFENLAIDLKKMVARKDDVVAGTVQGLEFLMKKNKIDVVHGVGTFKNRMQITVAQAGGEETMLEFSHAIIATGSKPVTPNSFGYDKKRVITSTEALNISKVPKRMVIVGGGVIGLEMGSVFARLGTEVEVVEFLDSILANMDKDCGKELQKSLKKLGMKFHLGHEVTEVKATSRSVDVGVARRNSDENFRIKGDYCLVAIGRRPYTDQLGLENAGIKLDDQGRIPVNDDLQTSVKNIYAIGDVIRGAMLAHKAEEEGIFVAELLAGQKPHINYNLIPSVVYTWPEVASVGATEQQCEEKQIPVKTGKFPIRALGRARASMDTEGMIKVIAHRDTDEVLGVHMVCARAADMIVEAAASMEFKASAEDIARISHPHPTYSEAFREAALAATGDRAIHI
jgi:dihydrolipoamide dehydrogenase